VTDDPLVRGTDPVVPEEVREILIAFAQQGENGQVILNLNNGWIESYKVVRYLRVVDRERANGSKSKDDGGRPDETSPKPITV
jgi:hypothetical protein